jgi:sugar/nucleoside kinase (ribokinase family)
MIEVRDLLVVGGLAIDRFPDGRTAAGGSVLHASRALAFAGLRGACLTVAGPEPEAAAALEELRHLGPLTVREAAWSIRYAIDERPERRVVTYQAGARLHLAPDDLAALPARAVLLAPIAAELDGEAVAASSGASVRVAALQGWLRGLVPGEPVRPRPVAALPAELRACTALVASDEDLGTDAGPAADALRAWAGAGPALVVTAGASGVLLDLPGAARTMVAAAAVRGVSSIGAGDGFAALFAARLGAGDDAEAAARFATDGVSRWLAARGGEG